MKNRVGCWHLPCTKKWACKIGLLALVAALANAVTAPTLQAQTGEMKPVVLATLSGYDALKKDINFLGSLAGQPDLASQFEPFILGFTQGLEKDKPLGVLIQSDGMNFGGAICVPIKDLATFVGNLKAFGVTTADAGNGITQITANNQTLFGKNAGGWTFLSMMPQMLESLPADPAAAFKTLTDEYDLGIRANVQNVPEPYRQMAIQQVKAGIDAGMKKMPEETDEQFQARKAMATAQFENIQRMINEIDQFTFGLSVDSEQQRTFLDFVYTAVAGSQLAEQLKAQGNTTTDFAGFFQPEATGMMMVAAPVTESDKAQTKQMVEALRAQLASAIEQDDDFPSDAKEAVKSAGNDFIDALAATIDAGKIDFGAVANVSSEGLTVVAGGFIADGAKIESGLKKLAEAHKEKPNMPEIKWGADSHAGVTFHTFSVPTPADEEDSKKLFGDTIDMAVGIGEKSVYFAMGKDNMTAVKKVIDDSAANPGKSVAPMELSVSVGQILQTAAAFNPEDAVLRMVADTLKNEAEGRDHVKIVAQPVENGLRSRFEIEEGVMRAIGVAVKAQQAQAMGQPLPAGAAQ